MHVNVIISLSIICGCSYPVYATRGYPQSKNRCQVTGQRSKKALSQRSILWQWSQLEYESDTPCAKITHINVLMNDETFYLYKLPHYWMHISTACCLSNNHIILITPHITKLMPLLIFPPQSAKWRNKWAKWGQVMKYPTGTSTSTYLHPENRLRSDNTMTLHTHVPSNNG